MDGVRSTAEQISLLHAGEAEEKVPSAAEMSTVVGVGRLEVAAGGPGRGPHLSHGES